MIRKRSGYIPLYIFIILLLSNLCQAEYIDDFKKRAKSIYLLHSVKNSVIKKNISKDYYKRKATIHERADSKHIEMLSYIPDQSPLLPYDNVEKIIERIDALNKKLEIIKEGEKEQKIKFDLAFEYFLLYLHYLHEKYGLTRSSHPEDKIPVTDKELEQYLALSQFYLQTFLLSEPGRKNLFINGRPVLKETVDISFPLRDNSAVYINVYFLAMMLECERLGGEWGNTLSSSSLIEKHDQKTWHWLDNLWKRRFKTNTTVYTPSSKTLFSLYELYLRYSFFGRYLRGCKQSDPLTDTRTRTLIGRLIALQKDRHLKNRGFYEHYKVEATKDMNSTDFLVHLYLARRGHLATRDLNFSIPKTEIFDIYRKLYLNGAKKIKHNISYRSNIYNELILFGVGIDNLKIMEEILYQYGLLSMSLQDGEGVKDITIKDSSRLTMAYLIANILDKKRRSGLDHDLDNYRDLAETLTPVLISRDNNYWEYASVIHSALAMFYSGKEGGFNESLAMYHAKRAFLAPCEKIAITFRGKKTWQKFFKLPGADSYLRLFTEFQKKYQTSPDAVLPDEFNSSLIIRKYSMKSKN